MEDQLALEVKEQVLSPGLRPGQPGTSQPLDPVALSTERALGVGDRYVEDRLAGERLLQGSRRTVDGVAFGQGIEAR